MIYLSLLLLPLASAGTQGDSALVRTQDGLIQGVVSASARVFRGIPFGTAGRWEAPVVNTPWGNSTLQATKDAPGCPQKCVLPDLACPPATSEDCLYLNVFTPLGVTPTSKTPVMFWIHGGSFHQGYAGGDLYDGTALVQHGVIIVAIQYRLGALGFMNRGSSSSDITGNYGIMDQTLAMKWISNNIAAFGGDPDAITIFGQSAGSQSVATHLLQNSLSKGLFHRAIIHSCPWGIPFRTKSQGKSLAHAFKEKTSCKSLVTVKSADKCLKELPVDQIVTAQVAAETDLVIELAHIVEIFEAWTPTQGTPEVEENLLQAWEAGHVQDIDVMIGTVHDEGEIFVYSAFGKPVSSFEEDLLLAFLEPSHISKVKDHYPFADKSDVRDSLVGVATEGLFICPTRHITNATAHLGRYLYHFDHPCSFGYAFWGKDTECYNMTCHGGDLPFVFQPDLAPLNLTYTPDELHLANSWQAYLTSFAITGTPTSPIHSNDCAVPKWTNFDSASLSGMNLTVPCNTMQDDPYVETCSFWDSIGYHFQ